MRSILALLGPLLAGCAAVQGLTVGVVEPAKPMAGEVLTPAAQLNRGCPQSAEHLTGSAIRSLDSGLRSLLLEGCRQSPSLRRLADAIGRTDGVVYITSGACPVRMLRGCLLHRVGNAPNARYLWIRVQANADWRELVGTMAHELHHALEVLSRSHVRSRRDMLDLYRSFESDAYGSTTASPYRTYETSAAINIGAAVRSELRPQSGAVAADERN